ncbi:MAG: ATP-binding protein [Alphaproteobacteria bacterium]|nr:ATP-binding protein [Alphaproteobacteria bacterium]
MVLDAWIPVGFRLPDGAETQVARFAGSDWQVFETRGDGVALVVRQSLREKWLAAGLIDGGMFGRFGVGDCELWSLSCGADQVICPVSEAASPDTKTEALAFALALKTTREINAEAAFQDAVYVEKISRLLPTYTISSRTADEVVLGYWLTGGVRIPATSFRRLHRSMTWLAEDYLREIVKAAGFVPVEDGLADLGRSRRSKGAASPSEEMAEEARETVNEQPRRFELPGRPELEGFFNEHIIDIVENADRYRALGIEFPSAVILHGPPGCGKTFAVERLVEHLGWPCFSIDASSVASPYIHDTSRKVAKIFAKATEDAPSVLVIDEMEAFLADRSSGAGSSHHRLEEVAEFLRRIPEAGRNRVLVVAMTNRFDMIDRAITRRGRFDHVIEVGLPGETEVLTLLAKLLSALPKRSDVDATPLARELAGRPLSDAAFVVRESARIAVRAGKDHLDQVSLLQALHVSPPRERESGESKRRIGFI